jgi:hypothetical protein
MALIGALNILVGMDIEGLVKGAKKGVSAFLGLKKSAETRIDEALPQLRERNYLFFMTEEELKLGARSFPTDIPIWVKGIPSPYGIWLHPGAGDFSHVAFRLGRRYRRFRGAAAIDDSARGQIGTALTFRISGDGRELWKSSELKEAGSSETFDADVAGVDKLELFVDCPGSHHYAHAVWVEPRLEP